MGEQIGIGIESFFANPTWITLLGLIVISVVAVVIFAKSNNKKSLENKISNQSSSIETTLQIIKDNSEQISKLATNLENERTHKDILSNLLDIQTNNQQIQQEFNIKVVTSMERVTTVLDNLVVNQRSEEQKRDNFESKVMENLHKIRLEFHDSYCKRENLDSLKKINESEVDFSE